MFWGFFKSKENNHATVDKAATQLHRKILINYWESPL